MVKANTFGIMETNMSEVITNDDDDVMMTSSSPMYIVDWSANARNGFGVLTFTEHCSDRYSGRKRNKK